MNGELLLNDTNNDETRCHGVHSSTRKKENRQNLSLAGVKNKKIEAFHGHLHRITTQLRKYQDKYIHCLHKPAN
jgi:uncharacterized protein YmfQ (DUF2313 family)